jgi:hypothetical protein
MFVTVTSIRLRSLWSFFALSWNALQILKQSKKQKGFVKMKSRGFAYDHYTVSLWETEEDLKAFARSGAHLDAMKKSSAISTEIRTLTYAADHLPSWSDAKIALKEKGKVLRF